MKKEKKQIVSEIFKRLKQNKEVKPKKKTIFSSLITKTVLSFVVLILIIVVVF